MEGQQPEQQTGTEQTRKPEPRIYVASLSDHNNGQLHGDWIDAAQTADAIHDEIGSMLQRSKFAGAKEWAIHDYEGFGSFRLSEYEAIETVARLAGGIAVHGEPFSKWAEIVGTSDTERLDQFDEHYRGYWPSLEHYAIDVLDDLGLDTEAIGPSWLQPYIHINYEALGRDLASDLEIADDGGGVHVFEAG